MVRTGQFCKGLAAGKKPLWAGALIFSTLLSYFFFTSSWHIPSRLVIEGNAQSACQAVFQWDSGQGYNFMQSSRVALGNFVKNPRPVHVVKIIRTGQKNPNATSSQILMRGIRADGQWIDFEHFQIPGKPGKRITLADSGKSFRVIDKKRLLLTKDRHGIAFQVRAQKDMEFWFYKFRSQGIVSICIDNDCRKYDLYSPKRDNDLKTTIYRDFRTFVPGHFKAAVRLPRYDIRRCRLKILESSPHIAFTSVTIRSQRGGVALPVNRHKAVKGIEYSDLQRNTRRFFHPVRFIIQLLLAALLTWGISACFRAVKACGGLKSCFFRQQRYVFWIFFSVSVLVFSTWLTAYWPGHMTSDSIHVWWAAEKPGYFIFSHPVLNVIYYRFLQQIWNNIAVVGVFQVLTTSLVGAYLFFFLFKNGVSLWLVSPFYLAFVTSVPIGLYNISLWKDIPFANAMLLIALLITKACIDRKYGNLRITREKIFAFILLAACLCLFRHNGLVYFIIIPAFLAVLKFISARKVLVLMLGMAVFAYGYLSIMTSLDSSHFFRQNAARFLDRLKPATIAKSVKSSIGLYPMLFDINSYREGRMPSRTDIWYSNSAFIHWNQMFTKINGYNNFIRYQHFNSKNSDSAWYPFMDRITGASYQKPWVYVTWNPFYMLYAVVGLLFFSMKFRMTLIFYTLILLQVGGLLLILGTRNYDWRYYYFFYISLYFLVPFLVMDLKMVAKRFSVSTPKIEQRA